MICEGGENDARGGLLGDRPAGRQRQAKAAEFHHHPDLGQFPWRKARAAALARPKEALASPVALKI
jgi:hypothetical protein